VIFVECDADTALVNLLVQGKTQVKHVSGKPKVCNRMEQSNSCSAMLDEDPDSAQHPYINKLKSSGIRTEISGKGIILLEDRLNSNQLILLRPRLEEWIIESAHAVDIRLSEYSLSDVAKELHTKLTLGQNRNVENFKKLLIELLQKSQRMKKLKELLEISI
jgi:hypothetical protein